VEGGDGKRPNDPRTIMVLLDTGCNRPPYPNPIATHDHELFLAIPIEKDGMHGLRVFGSELEDVSHLDSPGKA